MVDVGKKFYFITCKDRLVTYTDDHSRVKLFLSDRAKLGLLANYNVEEFYDYDLPEQLRTALDNIGNKDGDFTMVIQGCVDIEFALSTKDEMILVEYYDAYLANFSKLYDEFLCYVLNFKLTDIENEIVCQARDSLDEFSVEYLLSSHPEDSVFEEYDCIDTYELFKNLLKKGIIA